MRLKKLLNRLVLMTLVICLVNQVYAEKLDVPLKTLNNERINLKDYKTEKPLYIKLWATWCQECIKQMPHYVEAYKQYHDKIDFLSINLDINDDLQAVQEIIKQYQLSMPVVKDHNSAFTTAFDAVFTPFHVLINRDGTVVHKGFEASEALDKKIALLAKKDIDAAEGSVAKKTTKPEVIQEQGKRVLFFTMAWCDWYLQETRPEVSKNCVDGQEMVNSLYAKTQNENWQILINRIWTKQEDIDAYQKKYTIAAPMKMDTENTLFQHYKIKVAPTLIVLDDGIEKLRVTQFADKKQVEKMVQAALK
ncbi:redoxin family protein [Teredinibacter sp. KSP-S5-2]|uniref:redoxin family protein n=1 Tax=Teredinibacter sp. KSP-S5-2 TaxID=3034506 RepID=UPI002934C5FD|nr:redoxin family protein [Teredinibacter sp. KSP-S5-2]WNO09173.1 redoxin domain-containing protein [Teredinibacter sp. KSP-S5-2]